MTGQNHSIYSVSCLLNNSWCIVFCSKPSSQKGFRHQHWAFKKQFGSLNSIDISMDGLDSLLLFYTLWWYIHRKDFNFVEYGLFCGVTVMGVNATYRLNTPRYLLDHLRNSNIFYNINYLFKIFLGFWLAQISQLLIFFITSKLWCH